MGQSNDGQSSSNSLTAIKDIKDAENGSNNNNNNISSKTGSNSNKNNKGLPKPLVARISLWTTRTDNVKSTRAGGRDSGNNSGDDDDDDGGDEDTDEEDDYDMELNENAQLEKQLELASLPEQAKLVAAKELLKLKRTPSFMAEYSVIRSYLELMADLPWNRQTSELIDLKKCKRDLDNDHYGMQKLKERIIQYLAVAKLKQNNPTPSAAAAAATTTGRTRSSQPILMFVGPPGTGKTSIAQSIANSLGRKFQRISLGGVSDQSAIRGHRRTYIAAMPGRIIQGIKQVGVNNPVFLLDEVDKMSAGTQGDPSGALLEVLDPEQNHTFTDHYLNTPFNLSRVLFIATANSTDNIPPALIDRMEVIHITGYTHEEKFNIARRYLVPKQVIDNGLKANMVAFKDEAINKIISNYTREAGLRTLERRIATICRVVAVQIVEGGPTTSHQPVVASPSDVPVGANGLLPVIIDAASLERYLGPVIYERESVRAMNKPGVAIGLAWTPVGGEITFVEAEIMHGAKKEECLVLTGQLGSVMRESATLALNWIRSHHHLYDALPQTLGRDLADNTVHVHYPAGAVGKDGPSAGVATVVALMSLFSNISMVPDLAMTGEITLHGVVLKIGGVQEKVIAAQRYGVKRVILPIKNEPDLNDLSSSVRDKMKFHFVSTIDEVLRIAFDGKLATKSTSSITNPKFPMDPSRGLTSKL